MNKDYSLNRFFLFLLALIFVYANTAFAQVAVKGSVVDKDDLPLPSVNVLLLNPSDSTLIKGGITDESGTYLLKNLPKGSYILKISMVGFQTHISTPINLTEEFNEIETVALKESIEQLGEVSVTARRPLYEKKIDRLVVNVQRSITSSGSNVLDILEKSPGIQINRQSNSISLKGKSGVMVMINDKLVRLPIESVLTMLDGMSAANVEQIELISTPPAKYDAEGDAGVINIKMKEHSDLGYTGTVGGDIGYNQAKTLGGHFAFSRRKRNLAYFINYSINHDNNENIWFNERFLNQDGFTQIVRSDNNRDATLGMQNIRVGLELNIAANTTVDLLLTGLRRDWKTDDISKNFERSSPDTMLQTRLSIQEDNLWKNGVVNLGFTHSFEEHHTLGFDIDYLKYHNNNPSYYENDFLDGDQSLYEIEGIDVEKETPINIWVSKVDYRNKLSKNVTIETGLKGTNSNFFNDVRVSDQIDGNWVVNNTFTNKADLEEFIGAAYLSANITPSESFKINGGLRYEYIDRKLSSPAQGNLVDQQNGHFFPSLFIKNDLSDDNSIQFSYNRRITRPTFWDLAPFVFFVDPKTVFSGNSDLNSAISDAVSLGYSRNQLLFTLGYTHSTNEIARWQPTLNSETNEQTYRTENLNYLNTYSFTVSFPLEPFPWWSMQLNATGRYQFYRTLHLDNNISGEAAGLNSNFTSTFDLSNNYSIEFSGHYQSKSVWGISTFRPIGSLNVGIQKKISDGQGTFRLSATDILHTNIWQGEVDVESANLYSFWNYDRKSRSINFSFTWHFGSNEFEEIKVESGSTEEQERVGIN